MKDQTSPVLRKLSQAMQVKRGLSNFSFPSSSEHLGSSDISSRSLPPISIETSVNCKTVNSAEKPLFSHNWENPRMYSPLSVPSGKGECNLRECHYDSLPISPARKVHPSQQPSPLSSSSQLTQRDERLASKFRLPIGGLQRKPTIRTSCGGASLPRLNYAERFTKNVPLSPLVSKASTLLSARNASDKTLIEHLAKKNIHINRSPNAVPSPQLLAPRRADRRAVLISLTYNYSKHVNSMPSCVKDLSKLYDLLMLQLRFEKENIWVLSDELRVVPGAVSFTPTRENVINSLKWLIKDSRRGDQLMFYFCGQGCRVQRGRGHAVPFQYYIMPADYRPGYAISDTELHNALVQRLPDGATLTAVLDCHYSEKLMKLPFIHSMTKGRRRTFILEEELEFPEEDVYPERATGLTSLLLFGRLKRELEYRRKTALERRNQAALSCFDSGTVICIATSVEFELDQLRAARTKRHGILTSAFISYMKHATTRVEKISYRRMLCEMAAWMASNKEVRLPTFLSSHDLNPDTKITLL